MNFWERAFFLISSAYIVFVVWKIFQNRQLLMKACTDRVFTGCMIIAAILGICTIFTKPYIMKVEKAREVAVQESVSVQELIGKFPREKKIIHQLAIGVVQLRDKKESIFSPRTWNANGASSCLKQLYGDDGTKVLKEFNWYVEDDSERSLEDCSAQYKVTR